ncbi:anthranilate phosphoribosyltransferase [Buchananella felis]|uniref:anthranilate phosphoribosyltransferase n=1 Tax=Buchananella felis TaxID=3231492 RepID=UPI0035281FD1
MGAAPEPTTWPQVLSTLTGGGDLPAGHAAWAMDQVMSGSASPVQLTAFLISHFAKGPTSAEVREMADVMLDHAMTLDVGTTEVVDLVGTGGDGALSVNISTMAALVVAGLGIPVIKHGNRASTSACGSADVLAHLGVDLADSPREVAKIFASTGMGFCFANVFHPAMRHVAPVRRELGVPTVFNVLGPLTNPARPRAGAVGCAREYFAPIMAGVYASRGQDVMVFRARNGLDELTTAAVNDIWFATGGRVERYELDAVADLGLRPWTVADLRGGDPSVNAGVMRSLLENADDASPAVHETVLLNAAAAVVAFGTLPGTRAQDGDLVERMRAAYALAQEALSAGKALAVLENWVRLSQES